MLGLQPCPVEGLFPLRLQDPVFPVTHHVVRSLSSICGSPALHQVIRELRGQQDKRSNEARRTGKALLQGSTDGGRTECPAVHRVVMGELCEKGRWQEVGKGDRPQAWLSEQRGESAKASLLGVPQPH